jgi:hypothetical protein
LARSSNPDATPSIIIDNAYSGSLDIGDKGPALLIGSDITNLGGLVSINNTLGSFGFSGQRIDSLQFNLTVPNGVVAVSSNGPNGMFNAGGSPQGEYDGAISYPGGRPGSGPLNVDQAVIAAANALAAAAGYGNNVNYFLYGRQDEGRDPQLVAAILRQLRRLHRRFRRQLHRRLQYGPWHQFLRAADDPDLYHEQSDRGGQRPQDLRRPGRDQGDDDQHQRLDRGRPCDQPLPSPSPRISPTAWKEAETPTSMPVTARSR